MSLLSRFTSPRPATPSASARGDLVLRNLTKRYGSFTAVDDLSLVVPRGSFFALVGPSGCGKTTTLRMVAGLERPDGGRILLGDNDITDLRPYRRPVNTVFQSYALFPHLTVAGNVAFGPSRRGITGTTLDAQVDEALELVQLAGYGDRKPASLSGGQQQRVALARAIVNRPEVLLLDEPLGALDLKLRRQMQWELKRIQTEVGLTFVHVTHDQEEAMSMADTVAVMNQGVIEQLGPPTQLYDLPTTAFVSNFLGQSNLVPTTVVATEGDVYVVEVGGQRIRLLRSRSQAPTAGRRLLLGVRPEKVRLVRKDESPKKRNVSNYLTRARIVDVSFTGVALQYLVDIPGVGRWTVYEQNRKVEQSTLPGDEVTVAWDLRHTFGLPGDDDPTAGIEPDVVEAESDAGPVAAIVGADGPLR